MTDYLNSLLKIAIPFELYVAAAALVVVLLALFAFSLARAKMFKARSRENTGAREGQETVKPAEKRDILTIRGVNDLKRALSSCHDSELFNIFKTVGQHPRLQKVFTDWMKGKGEEKVIRLLAEFCGGENFNPLFGLTFLENNLALTRELTCEPEWHARYFAYRILVCGNEALTERNMEDGLQDPHPLIRKILTENISFDQEKKWKALWDKLIHDPVYEVREAARKRIALEFKDRYNPRDASLNDEESFRVLELLDPACQEDRNFASASMESLNKELRYPAAVFLDKCGALSALLEKNTLDDLGTMNHSVSYLRKALEVNVSGFLKDFPSGDGAPLLVAARLLSDPGAGVAENICLLENKVFSYLAGKKPEPYIMEIYTKTLDAVVNNGDSRSLEILAEELSRRENDKDFLELLLPRIPRKAESLFVPILFCFLDDPEFPARDCLIETLGTLSPYIILPKVFQILNGSRTVFPHILRVSAFKILGLTRQPYCLMRILESLPTLTHDEAEEFAHLFTEYPQDSFEGKVRTLLGSPDARIRAALIAILPVSGNEGFIKEIRAALKDVDPDVRVAAIKALLGFGEVKLLNQETSMLRDPVRRVRIATAEVIAKHGNAQAMDILRNIISDPNEINTVKISVISGLGHSSNAEGIKILVFALSRPDKELNERAVEALALRTTKRDITQLIEIFRDAEPQLREKLIPVFKAQGRKAEPLILEILKDEVASLKPYLVKILEETGFIDEAKRQLLNRNVEVRREAALVLSLLDTLPAFRGLVLAVKDPDQEVRVCVVKALEKLKNSHSLEILEKLKEDPDSRVRRYTHWALERLDSLAMD